MKSVKIISATIFVVLIGLTLLAFGLQNKVPKKVDEAFTKKFPTVMVLAWSQESDKEWEVEFDINRVEYSAHFLEDGTWKKTEHEIKKKSIPKNIKRILKSEFSKYKIVEAEFVETPEGIFYEFGLKKGKIEIEVVIDNTDKIIKKEIKENRD